MLDSPTVAAGTQAAFCALSIADSSTQEDFMGIANDSVTQNEIEEKRRQEAREELREEQRRKAERSLDRGLEDSFPASDPPNITQPPPTVYDRKPKR
jgi:L-fucose isomerase-like protein